ncbi:copper resistance protein CopB [Neokomagataea tanensis NBRC 106556]|uniref:Copper resistance protein CopB n=2 Tax=Acetobacteraceae TaxID=433 RepID=A0ABQ0QGL0_9PROT|nr:copper resistance protein CopB [Neokomagataea tanensis NBRC 106556]
MSMKHIIPTLTLGVLSMLALPWSAHAQIITIHHAADAPTDNAPTSLPGMSPVMMDQSTWFHGIFNQLEGRYSPQGTDFHWDGEMWFGTDYNRLWLRSEGTLSKGQFSDGQHEILYSRSISTYWNLQGGTRIDLDSGPTRAWAAFGVEGLALYQFELGAMGYVGGNGGAAARIEGSYDILLTNRLILQPQVELNTYTRPDPSRGAGSGLSDIDTGLRLRYEHWRKFAPYLAMTYNTPLGQARHFPNNRNDIRSALRFTFGLRNWF